MFSALSAYLRVRKNCNAESAEIRKERRVGAYRFNAALSRAKW